MARILIFIYGVLAYLAFLASFSYAVGFIGGDVVPKTIDSGAPPPTAEAVLINALLLGLFAVQHSIMARPGFKRRWTRWVPPPAERSNFVLIASLILGLMFWQWRPMPTVIWQIEHPAGAAVLRGLFAVGWLIVLYASFLIDHFDLFGLRQAYLHLRRREYHHPPFKTPTLYRMVRNPLMLGFLIAFWSTPVMTAGHLLFALLTTAYILVGINLEERDLARILGQDYSLYRRRTPMVLPFLKFGQRNK